MPYLKMRLAHTNLGRNELFERLLRASSFALWQVDHEDKSRFHYIG